MDVLNQLIRWLKYKENIQELLDKYLISWNMEYQCACQHVAGLM